MEVEIKSGWQLEGVKVYMTEVCMKKRVLYSMNDETDGVNVSKCNIKYMMTNDGVCLQRGTDLLPDITILTPSPDNYVVQNQSYLITWSYSGNVPDQISIKLADERPTNKSFAGNLGIGNVATSTKQFNWTIGTDRAVGDDYEIIFISNSNDTSATPSPVAQSGKFSIKAAGTPPSTNKTSNSTTNGDNSKNSTSTTSGDGGDNKTTPTNSSKPNSASSNSSSFGFAIFLIAIVSFLLHH
ncbi:4102_t:CDS:2 [Ambispora leptoticha]|uniref:4102_t:CDS:1 n=1 Tax=Ambispora leptoticha TaxID=144679 RepID=A0A9N8W1E2_9GLOM|nr:4102_t:CDS:2 [Ambispora leptoticha]